jgi:hypothetical protein
LFGCNDTKKNGDTVIKLVVVGISLATQSFGGRLEKCPHFSQKNIGLGLGLGKLY